uniref:C2H2-type domain-containing protein n=1 Tax=Elaeophora elaphi TaxID=1147741 RepID=A0A0R3S5W6_9BILA
NLFYIFRNETKLLGHTTLKELSTFNHLARAKEYRLSYNCAKCGYKATDKTKGLLHLKLHDKTNKLQNYIYSYDMI